MVDNHNLMEILPEKNQMIKRTQIIDQATQSIILTILIFQEEKERCWVELLKLLEYKL